MKKSQLHVWREKEIGEIVSQIDTLSSKLTSAYLTKSAGKLENTAMIKNIRRDIAWLKTIAGEKTKTAGESQS